MTLAGAVSPPTVCVSPQASRLGPNFSSVYKKTEQMINVSEERHQSTPSVLGSDLLHLSRSLSLQVIFTSLDLVLHTEALLSAVNFLSAAISSHDVSLPEKETRTRMEHKTVSSKSSQCNTHSHTHSHTHTHIRVFNVDNGRPVSCTAATCRL